MTITIPAVAFGVLFLIVGMASIFMAPFALAYASECAKFSITASHAREVTSLLRVLAVLVALGGGALVYVGGSILEAHGARGGRSGSGNVGADTPGNEP
jgi:hypothetical protein